MMKKFKHKYTFPLKRRKIDTETLYQKAFLMKRLISNYYISKFPSLLNPFGSELKNYILDLEQRLDVIIFRSHLVPTILSARQLISHGLVLVNNKVVNVSNYKVKIGDIIQLLDNSPIHKDKSSFNIYQISYIETDFSTRSIIIIRK